MYKEDIYEVYWTGPYKPGKINKKMAEEDIEKYVLYKVYGSHPVYGNNVLLYIGMTEQGAEKRLDQHDYWMDEERFGQSKIYVACIGAFKDWENSLETEVFDRPDRKLTERVEALLIYANQPSQNFKNKNSAKNSKNIRIFNTGAFGSLVPEISSLYHEL